LWGAFCHRLAAANEATKNMQIKIHRGLRWPQNDLKNTTTNQKRAALTEGGYDWMRERGGVQGDRYSIILGANELEYVEK
jgi:hypothetical protein